MSCYAQWQANDLLLYCHVQPGAKHTEFVGFHGNRLKIRLKAPPVDGKANAELLRFLSVVFSVGKAAITLESGELSRQKRIRITNPVQCPAELEIPAKP